MRLSLPIELFDRIPRHPDWKYEYMEGEMWLSHRPRALTLVREVTEPLPPRDGSRPRVRDLDPDADRSALTALLWDVWEPLDPYRTYAQAERREVFDTGLRRSLGAGAVPAGDSQLSGVVADGALAEEETGHQEAAVRGGGADGADGAERPGGSGLVGAVLLSAASWPDELRGEPELSWLSVRWRDQQRGVATALLGRVLERLRAEGRARLVSGASPANEPSLRWHLANGFRLVREPWRNPPWPPVPPSGARRST